MLQSLRIYTARRWYEAIYSSLAALAIPCAAAAQQYPTRPVRIIIPWPPGQATDLAARLVALKLTEILARAFIALIRAAPGKYNFASSGAGATAHLVAEIFNSRAGLQVTHVPYKGSAPAMIDVISGQPNYALETVAATLPHIKAGRLKAYGISTIKPSAIAPGIEPLATAANLPGFDAAAWIGVMVPSATPKPIVERLAKAIDTAMQSADTRERLAAAGLELDYRRTEEFAPYLKEQRARFAEVIKKNNIRIE